MDGFLYAVNAESGREVWRFRAGKRYGAPISPVHYKGILYHPSREGEIFAITLSGEKIWESKICNEIIGVPIIHKNRIYAPAEDSYLHCLDLNGEELWRFKTGNIMISLANLI